MSGEHASRFLLLDSDNAGWVAMVEFRTPPLVHNVAGLEPIVLTIPLHVDKKKLLESFASTRVVPQSQQ